MPFRGCSLALGGVLVRTLLGLHSLLGVGSASAAAHVPPLAVRVHVQPAVVPVGGTAYYTLELTGAAQAQPFELPVVPGLRVLAFSQTQRFSRVGGQPSVCAVWHYALSPQDPGSYTIPSFPLSVGQRQLIVPACQFGAHDPQCMALQDSPPPGGVPPLALGMDLQFAGLGQRTACYVGEALQAHISLRLPAGMHGVALGQPQRLGDAFAPLPLPAAQPSSQWLCHDGLVLQEHSWQEALAPLVPGSLTLQYQLSFQVPVHYTCAFASHQGLQQQASAPHDALPQQLGQQHHTLQWRTPVATLEVLPLPPPPPDVPFCGLVGRIDAALPLCPQSVQIGEPFSLALTLQGAFAGLGCQLPPLALPAGVTAVGQKPARQVPSPHAVGDSPAIWARTYTLVAQQAGALQLPALVFCSFDPHAAQYTTHTVNFPSIAVLLAQDAPKAVAASDSTAIQLPCLAGSDADAALPAPVGPELAADGVVSLPSHPCEATPPLQPSKATALPSTGLLQGIGSLGSRSLGLLIGLGAIVWIIYRWRRMP
jgi:hypothetical protein